MKNFFPCPLKLWRGWILPLLLMCFTLTAQSQIVYTDVDPDSTISASIMGGFDTNYSLDLNNDATIDFNLAVTAGILLHCGLEGSGCYGSAYVTPLSSCKVANSGGYPRALQVSEIIDSSLSWSDSPDQILRHITSGFACSSGFGNWSNPDDRYLGLKIISGGYTYYGWVRLSVSISCFASVTIKDYAFNSSPGSSIFAGETGLTASGDGSGLLSENDPLKIYPNPFSNSATISFSLPASQNVSLKIYDVTGRLVATLADETLSAGNHLLQWNTTNENGNAVSKGIYLLQLSTENNSKTIRIAVME